MDERSQKHKVLIVDDTPENIQVLMEVLKGEYAIVAAVNGEKALKLAAADPVPDIILLDVMMPEMDGYEVCSRLKVDEKTRNIPVVFVTALTEDEDEAKGLALGAVDYIGKPFNPELVKARVRNHLELKDHRDHLKQLVEEQTKELALTRAVMIESLGTLAEYRDPETGGHIKRTQNYVKVLAVHLKDHPRFRNELNDESIELLYLSAPLHDVGKVGVRDNILLKPGKLTDEEFEEMKNHSVYGHETLRITEQKLGKSTFLRYAREIAYTHQEKLDGSGYPQGLKGDEIPIPGRLMALADVYDALISKRAYKPPFPHEKAVDIIKEGKGSHFDPDIVDAFVALENTFRNIALTFADFEEEREMLGGVEQIETEGRGSIERILLVEDNEINLEIMLNQLVSLGYQIDTAVNGKEALIKYQENQYDVILTDLEMPEMDGYELVEKIRQSEENTKESIPVIAVTASDFNLTIERAKSLGFNGYMLKPFDMNVLKKKLTSMAYDDAV
jgi:putative two-component system response regulator